MTQVLQRYSKRQSNGHPVYSGTKTECQHYIQAEARRITHNFLNINDYNKFIAAKEFYQCDTNSVTPEMLTSPEVFNYMYESFLQYFYIEDDNHS